MMRFTPPEKIATDVRRDRAIVWGYVALSSADRMAAKLPSLAAS